jgi:N6-L-threonylcarbamoyladenine synthase
MKILGIESSCDESAASVISAKKIKKNHEIKVLSNIISSQINIHKKYGGVIPELAAREHVKNIIPVIDRALTKSKSKLKEIKAIAVAQGPGLITSLITGIETAKSLSFARNIPLIGINHIEGHIYANFINKSKMPKFPAIILTVSGGHTMLVLMEDHGKYKIVGETLDDAAGEAFDKAAQILGLGYPGGPAISKQASSYKDIENKKIQLPRPMINKSGFNFSFSGLKTALFYAIQKDKNYKKRVSEYAYEFEQAVVQVLVEKTIKASLEYKAKTIMLSGGVSANKELRKKIKQAVKRLASPCELIIPDLKYTTDNAAMIATAGYFHLLKNNFSDIKNIKVFPNKTI